ncbi:hypothetical protein IC617_04570 [Neiella sp. HB171785]|uniref:Uncharacterized protein n=1 Tax=Neiella litorisoli TaxID=2771431 RepID=A0A8J6UFC3_9GAMM|nr:hypothetical protein [Neiella litorisoli]MBD1388696.1 hypothetical protein [Neiella litorisoli]
MNKDILLAKLRALHERTPDFNEYSPTSIEHHSWLGQAHALINRWDVLEASSLKTSADFLSFSATRAKNISTIIGIVQRAISDLELDVPLETEQATAAAYGSGEVYDVFRKLNAIISAAEKSIFLIDPYLDDTILHQYLNSRATQVDVRLLSNKFPEKLIDAAAKYNQQYGDVFEVRRTKKIHDRVIFIDNFECWVVGQSLKDAAQAKPTYIAPLPPDVVQAKLDEYNLIWDESKEVL